jgi:ribokinase
MSDQRASVCVLGSINTDIVVRCPSLPGAGQTVLGGPFEVHPGGKGANQAVAAARAGADVMMIGVVGDDAYGSRRMDELAAEGIDISRVRRCAEPTGVALITVDGGGENTIVVAPGANAMLEEQDADDAGDVIRSADALLMQLEVPIDAVMAAARIARSHGTLVVLNAAPARPIPAELVGLIDLLVVNKTEAIELTNQDRPTVEALTMLGVASAVMTLGDEGAQYTHHGHAGGVYAFPVEPIDTVGAGDAFAGVLTVRWAEHLIALNPLAGGVLDQVEVLDAVCWACAAGALATTVRGATPSLPTREKIKQLLARHDPGDAA